MVSLIVMVSIPSIVMVDGGSFFLVPDLVHLNAFPRVFLFALSQKSLQHFIMAALIFFKCLILATFKVLELRTFVLLAVEISLRFRAFCAPPVQSAGYLI